MIPVIKVVPYCSYAFAIALLLSCNGIKDSLAGRCIYAGKVYLSDTLGGIASVTEADSSISIFLKDSSSNNYIYKTTTKEKGNFSIDFLEKNKFYKVGAEFKANNIKYTGSILFKAEECDRRYELSIVNDTIELILYAEIGKRNIVNVIIRDEKGNIVPKAEGCLFSSELLFNTKKCLNSNFTSTANEAGKLTFLNIPEGSYYLYVTKSLDTSATAQKISGSDFLKITSGIVTREIQIK